MDTPNPLFQQPDESSKANPILKSIFDAVLMGLLLSLGWSLRGQFGHLKGAMIPGAFAALGVALLSTHGRWTSSFGRAVILSGIGFAIGGHLAYGKLIEAILNQADYGLPELLTAKVFVIGAIWGGLGATFLGFGYSEKSFSFFDAVLMMLLFLFWAVPLELFHLTNYNLILFFMGFGVLHLYNFFIKKSKIIQWFGLMGFFGFGIAFCLSVLVLYRGNQGVFGDGWPWWALRDQFWGFLGGIALWGALQFVTKKGLLPDSSAGSNSRRAGFIFLLVGIPVINTFNLLEYWRYAGDFTGAAMAMLEVMLSVSFLWMAFILIKIHRQFFNQPILNQLMVISAVTFMGYMTIIGILKEKGVRGWGYWQDAYTFFVIFGLFLSGVFLTRLLLSHEE